MPGGHRAEKGNDGHRFEAPLLFENEAKAVAVAAVRRLGHFGILAAARLGGPLAMQHHDGLSDPFPRRSPWAHGGVHGRTTFILLSHTYNATFI